MIKLKGFLGYSGLLYEYFEKILNYVIRVNYKKLKKNAISNNLILVRRNLFVN